MNNLNLYFTTLEKEEQVEPTAQTEGERMLRAENNDTQNRKQEGNQPEQKLVL